MGNKPADQLAALSIQATAELTAAIGTLADRQAAAVQRQADLDAAVRYIKSAPQQAAVPASGIVTVDMDGPKTGYQWSVRRVTIMDAAAVTNSMGSAVGWIYAGQPSPLLATPENAEWGMSPLPNMAMFGPGELVLQYGEHLLVQLTGATVGEKVIVGIAYQLYQPALWSATRVIL
jgi:hypothetical protein